MPTKKKVYAVYLIKNNHHICMLESSNESIKERKLRKEVVYENTTEWWFYTTDTSPKHIKEVFKMYFMDCYHKLINEIDKYEGVAYV